MRLYKLTDAQGRTRAGYDNELYEHPLLAVLLNPIHANFNPATMRLFAAEGEIVAREGQLKCGVKSLTIVEEIPVPTMTTEQRVKFAILCAKEVCKDSTWNAWADKWLSGEDRSEATAARAARAAARAARATAEATAEAAAAAAWAATAWAAEQAEWAAEWAAAEAARAVARAVAARAVAGVSISLIKIAESL